LYGSQNSESRSQARAHLFTVSVLEEKPQA